MDQLFNDVFTAAPRRKVGPRARLRDAGETFELMVPLPGVSNEQLSLTAGDDYVTLQATREVGVPEGYTAYRRERDALDWERTFRLPERIDSSKVDAKLENGVLTIKLAKAAEAKARSIDIKAA
jgi:HSP20 family protein